MQDRLFILRKDFDDGGTRYFCPYSAQVVGYLTYYPEVRSTLEVVELDFAKPRRPVVDLVGESHQSAPILVLGGPPASVDGVTVGTANGHHFVERTIEILRYLAATRGTPPPH